METMPQNNAPKINENPRSVEDALTDLRNAFAQAKGIYEVTGNADFYMPPNLKKALLLMEDINEGDFSPSQVKNLDNLTEYLETCIGMAEEGHNDRVKYFFDVGGNMLSAILKKDTETA
jgi:hypothetical protein